MQISGARNTSREPLEPQSVYWLAVLVLLAELPHYLNLPWWVSLFGALVVLAKCKAAHSAAQRTTESADSSTLGRRLTELALSAPVLAATAALTAVAVRFHYGYFLGRDPCVAFLFLLISFKFAESRTNKDATLVVCLSGFLLLTQYFYSQTLLSAIITLPAVLTLGGALLVVRDTRHQVPVNTAIKLTGKLLLQGVPIAAVLFLVFPRMPGPLWDLPRDSVGQTGLSDSMEPGSISGLSQSSAVAFRVDFDGSPPPKSMLYWRGPVLTQFDGRGWKADPAPRPATPAVAEDGQALDYTVTLEPHRRKWLFALDVPVSLPSKVTASGQAGTPLGSMMTNLQMISPKVINTAVRYRQSSILSGGYTEHEAPLRDNLRIAGRNHETLQFAARFRQQFNRPRDYAEGLMRWFSEQPFFYTLQPGLLGDTPIDEFLFSTRKGFCEHYASAMAILLRAASIPARVVTGYQGGSMNGDYMIIRQSDAHAWVEAWIDGSWRRYDPTAAVAPDRVNIGLGSALGETEPVPMLARNTPGFLRKMQLRWDAINHDWKRFVVDFNNESQTSLWKKLGINSPAAWQIVGVILLALGTWCAFVLGFSLVRRSERSEEDKLWSVLCRKLGKAGLPRAHNEGPRDYCQRATENWPAHASELRAVFAHLTNLRFANPGARKRELLLAETQKMLAKLPRFSAPVKNSVQRVKPLT